jgi:futalosine hydrolase
VSTCSGTDASSAELLRRTGARVETMEGAAVALACRLASIPLVQLRAVSNLTGDRDKAGWDLGLAVSRVQTALIRVVEGWPP